MYFPILIKWMGPFPILGCWVVFFIFIQILKETSVSKQCRTAVSDLVLHCLSMSHKKDARQDPWVKTMLKNVLVSHFLFGGFSDLVALLPTLLHY